MKPLLEDVPWDSDFFGYKVGKLSATTENELEAERLLTESNAYHLIYVFADRALNLPQAVAKLVDRKVTMHQQINKSVLDFHSEIRIEAFDLNKDSYSELEQLALLSGVFSRFKRDENFTNNEYNRLYTQWIYNSAYKKTAFEILVAKISGKIIGFVSLEKKTETLSAIGLIAVAPHAQGKGIGFALIQEAKKRSLAHSFSEIQVVTQAENTAALFLYKKADFNQTAMKYIYHHWNR
jgi:dTDP-4-amino-4,6-dideoxy-D-galactose acyltransferase